MLVEEPWRHLVNGVGMVVTVVTGTNSHEPFLQVGPAELTRSEHQFRRPQNTLLDDLEELVLGQEVPVRTVVHRFEQGLPCAVVEPVALGDPARTVVQDVTRESTLVIHEDLRAVELGQDGLGDACRTNLAVDSRVNPLDGTQRLCGSDRVDQQTTVALRNRVEDVRLSDRPNNVRVFEVLHEERAAKLLLHELAEDPQVSPDVLDAHRTQFTVHHVGATYSVMQALDGEFSATRAVLQRDRDPTNVFDIFGRHLVRLGHGNRLSSPDNPGSGLHFCAVEGFWGSIHTASHTN